MKALEWIQENAWRKTVGNREYCRGCTCVVARGTPSDARFHVQGCKVAEAIRDAEKLTQAEARIEALEKAGKALVDAIAANRAVTNLANWDRVCGLTNAFTDLLGKKEANG